jgi:pimeloyl-ACP methyl ester carboxylesterase
VPRSKWTFYGRPIFLAVFALLACQLMQPVAIRAHEGPDEITQSTELPKSPKQIDKSAQGTAMKTLGGRQFWGDVKFFRGWRIQQNVFTEHYRLLDPKDNRHAYGSLKTCCDALEEIKVKRKLPPMSGKAAICIHGITRSSKTYYAMRPALEKDGYIVVGFDYPSTRIDIQQAAGCLNRVIQSLDGVEQIDLVVHSLGGLVARAWFKDHHDPRIKRVVMLGVPNRGAEMADLLRKNSAFRLIMGPAGQQLVTGDKGTIAKLPVPPCEFAVIAGGRGADGYNPLVAGDDDLIVSVESTRLPGAADFLLVRAIHTFLLSNPEAVEATVRFLDTGHFRKDGSRKPIPRIPKETRTAELNAD